MTFWSKRDDPQRFNAEDPWIVEECAAFLTGRYRELLEQTGQPVPVWAWLNALAHGEEELVARLAAGPAGSDTPDAYVARFARHTCHKLRSEGRTLKEIQATVLIPLELALASRLGTSTPDSTTLPLAVSRELVLGLEPIDVRRGHDDA